MKRTLIPIIFFVADRILKFFSPSMNIGGGFLRAGFYPNSAGAFSLPISGMLYNFAGLIFLGIFVYLFIKELKSASGLQLTAYGLIILGGASNMFDRLAYGYVIDYFNFLDYSFFNIADAMLVLGIVVLLLYSLKLKKNNSENSKSIKC